MNHNVGVDFPGFIAWDGTNSRIVKIDGFANFGFTFKVTETLTEDVTFNIFYHEALGGNPCVPGPAIPVPEILFCDDPRLTPSEQSTVTIPAGTTPDDVCAGTIPCRHGYFISIAPADAENDDNANVDVVVTMKGITR